MDKPTSLLSAELSRYVRRQLGLSQKDVIEGTGLPGYKIKQWEVRGLEINVSDLRTLRNFYAKQAEDRGVSFEDIEARFHASTSATAPTGKASSQANSAGEPGLSHLGFLISPKLAPEVVDQLMADMEATDERVAAIVKTGIKSGLFGGLSDETEGLVRELFGLLAANHLRFRCLQGRNIIEPTRDEAKTVGGYLAQWLQTSGVAHVIAAPAEATTEQE
ncbi:hypothetical protein [uncultured Azohydromonas sp.]|mgnify:CR=1 FL=1|jgi:hypothetical protein|uniref:hypothetical protein n=1 Tax=uncultured Azohydromonas sp. TaxID=487342 RepID=UPI00261B2CA4|nr:hypothetical protein [uncultured Azohydromonas sp.]